FDPHVAHQSANGLDVDEPATAERGGPKFFQQFPGAVVPVGPGPFGGVVVYQNWVLARRVDRSGNVLLTRVVGRDPTRSGNAPGDYDGWDIGLAAAVRALLAEPPPRSAVEVSPPPGWAVVKSWIPESQQVNGPGLVQNKDWLIAAYRSGLLIDNPAY